jgi:hypothetical protein
VNSRLFDLLSHLFDDDARGPVQISIISVSATLPDTVTLFNQGFLSAERAVPYLSVAAGVAAEDLTCDEREVVRRRVALQATVPSAPSHKPASESDETS